MWNCIYDLFILIIFHGGKLCEIVSQFLNAFVKSAYSHEFQQENDISQEKMAVQTDTGGKDDLKTQFVTREGTYRLMTLSEYSRPNRVGYTNTQGSSQVRVSLVTLPPGSPSADASVSDDRICFNYGKELYVYVYKGVKKVNPARNIFCFPSI